MINRIIVGVDFSDASRSALTKAAAWAERLGKPLLAVHVLQPPAPMLPEAQIALPDPAWLQSMEDRVFPAEPPDFRQAACYRSRPVSTRP